MIAYGPRHLAKHQSDAVGRRTMMKEICMYKMTLKSEFETLEIYIQGESNSFNVSLDPFKPLALLQCVLRMCSCALRK